ANHVLTTYYSVFTNAGPTLKLFGIPVANQVAGDLHWITAQAFSGTGSTTAARLGGAAAATIVDMPIAIGSALLQPTISDPTNTPYPRLRAVLPAQPEYDKLFELTYQQSGSR